MGKLEKLAYDTKYTIGSYLDASMSLPIYIAEKVCVVSEKIFGKKTPKFLTSGYTKDNSLVYSKREKLRKGLDTKPGMLYLQSNFVAVIPFFLVGMPSAELAQAGIEKWTSGLPEVLQYTINSSLTLASQMATGYSIFMVNEVRTNKHKYLNEKGRLSPKEISKGFFKAIKTFLSFDIPYTISKIGGQSLFLSQGKDPWKASGITDLIAIPAWYALAIPLGLHNGLIETNKTRELFKKQNNSKAFQ